jgi:rhodanese-related sulfurtransferase
MATSTRELEIDAARAAHFAAKLEYEIDAWDLNAAREEIIVIDARSADAYAKEHIPNAVSFPHRTMSAEATQRLRRDVLYVTYCDGIGCNASTKGALNLARLGFRVKELIGGLDWWKRDGYATEGATSALADKANCAC